MTTSRVPDGICCPNCDTALRETVTDGGEVPRSDMSEGTDRTLSPVHQPDRLKGTTLSCEGCETDLTVFFY